MEVINFNLTAGVSDVIIGQPVFKVYDRTAPEITFTKNGTFLVQVACQTLEITRGNIQQIKDELAGKPIGEQTRTAIVPIGRNPSVSSPVFLEKSKSHFISETLKCYSNTTHMLSKLTFTPTPEYFQKTQDGEIYYKHRFHVYRDGVAGLVAMFNIMSDYFDSHPVK